MVQAEMCDMRADPLGPMEGVVIESKTDKGLGYVYGSFISTLALKIFDFSLLFFSVT